MLSTAPPPVYPLQRRRPPSRLSLLSEACRSAYRTACPRKQTGSRLSFQLTTVLPYLLCQGVLSRDPGSRVRLVRRHCNRPYAAPCLPPVPPLPEVEGTPTPPNHTPMTSPGFGVACLFPRSVLSNLFASGLLRFGFVFGREVFRRHNCCMHRFVPRTD